jgi:hypothetical protein
MPIVNKNQGAPMNLAQAVQKGAVAPPSGPAPAAAPPPMSMSPGKMGAGQIVGKPKQVAPAAPAKKKLMPVKNVGKPVKKMRFM